MDESGWTARRTRGMTQKGLAEGPAGAEVCLGRAFCVIPRVLRAVLLVGYGPVTHPAATRLDPQWEGETVAVT